jgi:hypothetical protein
MPFQAHLRTVDPQRNIDRLSIETTTRFRLKTTSEDAYCLHVEMSQFEIEDIFQSNYHRICR